VLKILSSAPRTAPRHGARRRTRASPAAVAAVLAACLAATPAGAQSSPAISDGVVKLGLLPDLSGPYASSGGEGSVTAARMAIEDFGGSVLGAPIRLVVVDDRSSTEVAAATAREWFATQHVDAIMDVSASSPALAVQAIARTRHKIVMLSSAAAERLTNEACSPTSVHYVFDTYAVAHTLGKAIVLRGGDTWFFITVDYSFGYDLEDDTVAVVKENGGKVLGHARYPLGATDFTSYLARARQSEAKVVALANGGRDLINAVRQAASLGLARGGQIVTGLSVVINAVHQIGLATAQGMMLTEAFYWDMNNATRAWSRRFFDRRHAMPNSLNAGVYSSTMHYLKAVQAAGTDATEPVMRAMRQMPIDDFFSHRGHIRADGVMIHDMYLFQVKKPDESHHPWDYYKLLATIPGDQTFRPLWQSQCPLVKRE
jgi:branched-chain amino acid transport system substrate-binding protein